MENVIIVINLAKFCKTVFNYIIYYKIYVL